MVQRRRLRWLILGAAILIPAGLLLLLWAWWTKVAPPSKIANFEPTEFSAVATAPFFYSVGDELKHSDEIDPRAPTLLHGRIKNFLVSPDGSKIAVVANGLLTVVGWEGPKILQVAPVDSVYKIAAKQIGHQFFRDDHFQWSRDSKQLYLIRDEYYQSKGIQLFSEKGELWKFNV